MKLPIREILNVAKDFFKKHWPEIQAKGVEFFQQHMKDFDWETVKIAISYEEHSFEKISFGDLVGLVKERFSLSHEINICVLKTENSIIALDVVATDEHNEPVFSANTPWCHICAAEITDDLRQVFNGKEMIVLR